MKKCNACGAEWPNNAAACSNDGEASFGPAFDFTDAIPLTNAGASEIPFHPAASRSQQRRNDAHRSNR